MPPIKIKGTSRPKRLGYTLRRLLSYLAPYRVSCILIVVCTALSSLASVLSSYSIKIALNSFILPLLKQEHPSLNSFILFLSALLLVLSLGAVASYISARMQLKLKCSFLYTIRKALFSKLQALPIAYFDKNERGVLNSLFTNDTESLRDMLTMALPELLNTLITVIAILVVMLIISPLLTLIMLVLIFIVVLFSRVLTLKSLDSYRRQQADLGKLNSYSEEMLNGIKEVKAFNYQERARKEFWTLNKNLQKSATNAAVYSSILGPIMGNFSYVEFTVIAIVEGILIIHGMLDIGGAAAFLQYVRNFSRPITQVSSLFASVLNALAGAERIFFALDEKEEEDSGKIDITKGEGTEEGEVKGIEKIEFKEVSFSYNQEYRKEDRKEQGEGQGQEERLVLDGVSFCANKGDKVAIIGKTGGGKTTIINLLLRFYDLQKSGEILINGTDIKKITRASLYASVGVVLQDTFLFSGTIMENIRLSCPEATKEEVIKACKLANATHFINALPNKYDTVLDPAALSISSGEAQLLAIARAILKNPSILILDEATSSIDTRTEKLIQDALNTLMEGRTVFIIAHRLSTIQNASLILKVDSGKVRSVKSIKD